jgi:hypothetical protein
LAVRLSKVCDDPAEFCTGFFTLSVEYFDDSISPALTPLVIELGQSFPFLSNLSTSLIFSLYDPTRQESMYARVKVPSNLKLGDRSGARPEVAGAAA